MTTVALPRPISAVPPTAATGWAPLLVVLAGTFVTFLDFFIVNVALPSIHGDLHAGPAAMSLVVAGYGLTFATGMITGGRLGDIYGRRRGSSDSARPRYWGCTNSASPSRAFPWPRVPG